MQTLFQLYKSLGSRWVAISKYLPRHTEGDIKNKFYTTLKRVATQAQLEDPVHYDSHFVKCKKNLIQFVDAAIQYSHLLSSKKGRKKNCDKLKARSEGLLFPKSLSPAKPMEFGSNQPQLPYFPDPYQMSGMQPIQQIQPMQSMQIIQPIQPMMQHPSAPWCQYPMYMPQPPPMPYNMMNCQPTPSQFSKPQNQFIPPSVQFNNYNGAGPSWPVINY